MSHKYPRIFRIAAMCCALLAGFTSAQKRSNVAVLELAGNGIDTAGLSTLTNRLRAELFETQKFIIVERGEMEAILKEQGFQQTGCTDAACAVQAGQLLNAEYMIVGTVDHIGRVYSVNIRQISVANGAIANNVRNDCADCTIEDVMLKMIRHAARQIAGIDTTREQEVVTEQKGRKSIKCKNYTGGDAGTLIVSGVSPNEEVLVDDISYGNGNMVIDYVPVGKHIVCVKYDKKGMLKEKVSIAYGKSTEFDFLKSKNLKYHFCIGPGLTIDFPDLSDKEYQDKFVNENNANDTITAPNISFAWLPVIPTLSFDWTNQKNAIGFTLGAWYTKEQVTNTDSAGNKFVYDLRKLFAQLLFTYYRTVLNVQDNLKGELGFLGGVSYCDLAVFPKYGIVKTTQVTYFSTNGPWEDLGRGSSSEHGYISYIGPSVVINAGYKFVYCKVAYFLLLGTDASSQTKFTLMNNLGLTIGFKF